VFGLLVDVHQAALLGQHALAYSALTYFAITIHRRLLWFAPHHQAVQILPLFAATHLIIVLLRWIAGEQDPVLAWTAVFAPLLEALLWPVFSAVLLAPQRRAPDPDANRPL
ncbi:MAG: rod shape-determining protein MreD, partial [Betaproteobacteria bacterium]|nr:rod shape-determining protein MreD [Betaproteobacteria bacterium]